MKIIKNVGLMVVNYFPVLLALLCYKTGWICDILIILAVLFLTFINHKFSDNFWFNLLFQVNLIISAVISVNLATNLYYENVIQDLSTLIIGELFRYVAMAVALIPILIFAFLKVQNIKRGR